MAKLAGSIKAWASNPVHLVGDFPGDDTKVDGGDGVINAGFIPGDVFAPTAEETNHEFGRWTSVLQWVQDGTSASVAVAGIVERSATGQINAERLIILNTQGQSGIDATGDNGETGVVGRSTRTGVHGIGSGAFPAVLGASSANGAGVQGTSTSGYGGRFTGGSAQAGVRTDGSAAGSPGLEANGTNGEPDIFLTPAANFGIDIQCGASALGGIRILSNGQLGLYISQDDPNYGAAEFYGDTAQASGVPVLYSRAFGAGDAMQLVTSSSTGFALRLSVKTAAPTVGAIFCAGQAARPSDITRGQFTYLSVEKQWAHSEIGDFGNDPGGGWRGFLSTVGGSALGFGSAPGLVIAVVADAWIDSVLCVAAGGDAPKVAGRQVMIRISMMARTNTASASARLNLQLLDMTAGGGEVWVAKDGSGIHLPDLGPAPLMGFTPIMIEVPITVPLAGDRIWKLRYATDLNSVAIKNVVVAFGPGMR